MTLIIGNYCTSKGYDDQSHDSSEKWLQSLEYNTALLGATKYNTKNHPFWKPFIEHSVLV